MLKVGTVLNANSPFFLAYTHTYTTTEWSLSSKEFGRDDYIIWDTKGCIMLSNGVEIHHHF